MREPPCGGFPWGTRQNWTLTEETVRWYLDNQEWMDNITSGEYEKYYEEMYNK